MEDIRGVRLRKFKLRKIVLGVRMHFRHMLCAPGECSSWEYLGLLGPILFLIYMDDIQHCTIVTVDFTYLLMTLMYVFLLVVKQYQTLDENTLHSSSKI